MTSTPNPELVQANLETLLKADIPAMTMMSTMMSDGIYASQVVNLVVERDTGKIMDVRNGYYFFDDASPLVNVSTAYQTLMPDADSSAGPAQRLVVLDDEALGEEQRAIIQASCAGYAQAVAT